MKLRPNRDPAGLPAAGLSACVLGLVLCPYMYIAIGALGLFAPEFSIMTLPPLVVSSCFLLYRFLSKPTQASSRRLLVAAEIFSWIVIAAFLTLIADFSLATTLERLGLSCAFFSLASVLCLPAVLMRTTALRERMMRLPKSAPKIALPAIIVVSAIMVAIYLIKAPTFIGGKFETDCLCGVSADARICHYTAAST